MNVNFHADPISSNNPSPSSPASFTPSITFQFPTGVDALQFNLGAKSRHLKLLDFQREENEGKHLPSWEHNGGISPLGELDCLESPAARMLHNPKVYYGIEGRIHLGRVRDAYLNGTNGAKVLRAHYSWPVPHFSNNPGEQKELANQLSEWELAEARRESPVLWRHQVELFVSQLVTAHQEFRELVQTRFPDAKFKNIRLTRAQFYRDFLHTISAPELPSFLEHLKEILRHKLGAEKTKEGFHGSRDGAQLTWMLPGKPEWGRNRPGLALYLRGPYRFRLEVRWENPKTHHNRHPSWEEFPKLERFLSTLGELSDEFLDEIATLLAPGVPTMLQARIPTVSPEVLATFLRAAFRPRRLDTPEYQDFMQQLCSTGWYYPPSKKLRRPRLSNPIRGNFARHPEYGFLKEHEPVGIAAQKGQAKFYEFDAERFAVAQKRLVNSTIIRE